MTALEDAYGCLRMARGRQKGVLPNSTAFSFHEKQLSEHHQAKGQPSASFSLFGEDQKILLSPQAKSHT